MDPISTPMYAQRRLAGCALVLCLSVACGSEDDGEDDGTPQTESTIKLGELPCGNVGCPAPEGLPGLLACCMDAIAGKCGVKARRSDDCRAPPESDARCVAPQGLVDLAASEGIGLYGCCTMTHECGFGTISEFDISNPWFGIVSQGGEMFDPCTPLSLLTCGGIPEEMVGVISPKTCDGDPIEVDPDTCSFGGRGDEPSR
jgi:hypothetical protein